MLAIVVAYTTRRRGGLHQAIMTGLRRPAMAGLFSPGY